ncbi:MAG: hypothetical protein KGI26_03960 [Thaumarchaeota archaeon]|nr:hypothetical protein [Nitrososphaerota archaeon]
MARGDRAPASVWAAALAKIASALSESEANDFVVFGSQAMSVWMERALPSKDLDLVVPGVSPRVLELVRGALGRPEYDFGVFDYEGRDYPVGHFYLRHADGTPLVVELFQTFLGFDARRLTPYLTFRERWGMRLQVMVPEAVVATRLSFRPPERITPFNAARLSRFVRGVGKVDWKIVNAFLDDFGLREVALENLRHLRAKRIAIPGASAVTG